MSAPEARYDDQGEARPADTVAGFLASLAIFAALIGVAWHPLRLIPAAMVLALLAAAMSAARQRFALAAVLITAVCFFAGMAIAVIAQKPLW